MKIINAGYEIMTEFDGHELERIERIARTCYKSEDKITKESAPKFVAGLIKRKHEAMLEHGHITVKFICDRGVSHELVRHRLASFAQESTRYCNYGKDGELTFIKPCFWDIKKSKLQAIVTTTEFKGSNDLYMWTIAMQNAESMYLSMIESGASPQEARSVLPNSVKTEVVMTANYREWRHFFNLRACRATGPAHPQMEEITRPLLRELSIKLPVIFDDLVLKLNENLSLPA